MKGGLRVEQRIEKVLLRHLQQQQLVRRGNLLEQLLLKLIVIKQVVVLVGKHAEVVARVVLSEVMQRRPLGALDVVLDQIARHRG